MGMYTTICGEEVKFSGLLATAARNCGIVADYGMATISRSMASSVLASMVSAMENGRQLVKGHSVEGQSLYKLRNDAHVLALLFDWMAFDHEDELVFG